MTAFTLRRLHQAPLDQGDGIVSTAAAVHDDIRLRIESDASPCTGSGETPGSFPVERKPMPADRIDRRSCIPAKSVRLQREGEGQAEFRGAVEAGGHPFGAQAGHGLSCKPAASCHDSLSLRQLEEDTLPRLGIPRTFGDCEEGIDQALLHGSQARRRVPIACLPAHAPKPQIEIVNAGQVLGGTNRHVDAPQWNGQIRLPVALDVAVSLERLDSASGAKALDGSSEIKRLSCGPGTDLGSAFSEQPAQFSVG